MAQNWNRSFSYALTVCAESRLTSLQCCKYRSICSFRICISAPKYGAGNSRQGLILGSASITRCGLAAITTIMDAVSDFWSTKIVEAIEEILGDSKVKLVRLTGPPGSAKSTIAKQVAANWENGGWCVNSGDRRQSQHWSPILSVSCGLIEVRAIGATGASRIAFGVQVLDVLHGTGGIASNLFDMMSSTRGQKAERASRILSQLERIFLVICADFAGPNNCY